MNDGKWAAEREHTLSVAQACLYLQRNKEQPSRSRKATLSIKKEKKENSLCVLLSGIISQCTAPSTRQPSLLCLKATFVASNFQEIACSWKAKIWELTTLSPIFFFCWNYPQSFGFSQHDSKPSAPIRISGLTCFHTLLPYKLSICWQPRICQHEDK